MHLDSVFKVGDTVCSFDDWHGTVKQLNYLHGHLSSVTVKWHNGSLMTHPLSADDIWLEGQAAKDSPEIKSHQWFITHQDEINSNNLALQHAYKAAVKQAMDAKANIVWVSEPVNENATLEALAQAVANWCEIVTYVDGNIKDEFIKHDLFTREYLHGLINGLKMQGVEISNELLTALAQADQYFIQHSIALAPPSLAWLNDPTPEKVKIVQDLDVFWYEYRWPRPRA